ncbi:hypothetical protein [Mucilaginibacter terrae]|uniref:DUF4595 domain-containing protein n=1 Tax=Mucilaginibacter terrae TaxID=1955052 RepID=A0ABU3GWI8_9SPHI|nr:hypothetical protein [Mucilaginibacter terrae]MDT3404132.1 hypothetical protein [Mucilaginibacter terrae]
MKPFTIFNRFLTITLASAALLTTSCKKDNEKTPDNGGAKLVKIEESASEYTSFGYNAAGKVDKITSKGTDGEETIQIAYDANHPTTATTAEGSTKFIYANNKLDIAELYAGTTKFGQIKINYVNGTVNNVVVSHNLQGNSVNFAKTVYEYYANGDIKKETDYGWNMATETFVISGSTTFEYDDKNNPLLALGDVYQIAFSLASKHNPVKQTEFDEDGALNQTTTYTYTYNNNAYPVTAQKKVTVPGQANPTVSNIKYTYQ